MHPLYLQSFFYLRWHRHFIAQRGPGSILSSGYNSCGVTRFSHVRLVFLHLQKKHISRSELPTAQLNCECVLCRLIDLHPVQSVSPLHAQSSRDRLRIHRNPDQESTI